jgi:hypothetical protein
VTKKLHRLKVNSEHPIIEPQLVHPNPKTDDNLEDQKAKLDDAEQSTWQVINQIMLLKVFLKKINFFYFKLIFFWYVQIILIC